MTLRPIRSLDVFQGVNQNAPTSCEALECLVTGAFAFGKIVDQQCSVYCLSNLTALGKVK